MNSSCGQHTGCATTRNTLLTDAISYNATPHMEKIRRTDPSDTVPHRRRVRFNEKVIVHNKRRTYSLPNDSDASILSSSTYLSSNELATIQHDLVLTLKYRNRMQKFRGDHNNTLRVPTGLHYCRGLEEYSTEHAGYLKASTIRRRKNAVQAILQEQATQQRQSHHSKSNPTNNHHRLGDEKERAVHRVSCGGGGAVHLRAISEHYSRWSHEASIALGKYDSEQAFDVYFSS